MRWLVVAVAAGCSGRSSAPPPKPVPADAPVARPLNPAPTDPVLGVRTDDRRVAPPARQGHPIDVILRSTPQNAEAAVDGVPLGPTPAYWNGVADGREHEFTFVLPGHAVARYRFVPITSGVIHARLEPISDDQADAGVADPPPGIPVMTPPPPPVPIDAAPPPPPIDAAAIAPPPTVITPDANRGGELGTNPFGPLP